MRRRPKDPLLIAFGRKVAELRSDKGLTQEELASEVGKAARYIQAIEAGDQNVTLLTLGLLASALEVTPGELLSE